MTDNLITLPVNFAHLARQIAMDILPLRDILTLNDIDEAEWDLIQKDTRFQTTLADMVSEWNSAANTKNRVRIKSATGIEALLEPTIASCMDPGVPLNQRTEAMKFLAKLGELLDVQEFGTGGNVGDRVQINIYTGNPDHSVVIDAKPFDRTEAEDVPT